LCRVGEGFATKNGERRMNDVRCINCSKIIAKSPHNLSTTVIFCCEGCGATWAMKKKWGGA
jgi:hypothetical protein